MSSLIGARDERKVTPGITELSRPRVHIDGAACYIDVGSTYPGSAEASKGAGVHRLKGSGNYVASLFNLTKTD